LGPLFFIFSNFCKGRSKNAPLVGHKGRSKIVPFALRQQYNAATGISVVFSDVLNPKPLIIWRSAWKQHADSKV